MCAFESLPVPEKIMSSLIQVGIDIGCRKLPVLFNGQEVPNLDLTLETDKIIRYQKNMNRHSRIP